METIKPNPIPCKKLPRELSWRVRMLYCIHYSKCLDQAVDGGWQAFKCTECAYWNKSKRTVTIGDVTGRETRDEVEEFELLLEENADE